MKGVLVRVGIDASCGFWNAPYETQSGRFVYVPIPEGGKVHPHLARCYSELSPFLEAIGVPLPTHLTGKTMHLDPDFETLTYGDVYPRSIPLLDLQSGDFVVFYSSLRAINPDPGKLFYALIGVFFVKEVVAVDEVPQERWCENAHTRRVEHGRDIIVRGQSGASGRFDRLVSIGEYRDRAYRVRKDVLEAWGGLSVRDGYLQRSGRLPKFSDPRRFLKWLGRQAVKMEASNWA